MSEKQYQDKIVSVRKQIATEETNRSKASAAAAKYRAEASREAAKITPRTSSTQARLYQRNASSAEDKAVKEDAKVAAASTKAARLAGDLATAESNLDREIRATARQHATKRRETARREDAEATRRRRLEETHARRIAQMSRPVLRYVHEVREVPPPKPEPLRVLYLTANPEQNLRTEVEVHDVQDHVQAALHRDLVTIKYRPAATPDDLVAGLNDLRPHVVHFSGHAGDAALLFDNASVDEPEGRPVAYDLLSRALGATSTPPVLLVLNGCDTLDGAEVLLDAVAVVIATAASISDLAASIFASKFYAAIAAAQPIGAAVDQGAVSVDLAGLSEGWKHHVLARPDLDVDQRVLVEVPPTDSR